MCRAAPAAGGPVAACGHESTKRRGRSAGASSGREDGRAEVGFGAECRPDRRYGAGAAVPEATYGSGAGLPGAGLLTLLVLFGYASGTGMP
jgi:hypothetical protein